MAGLPYDHDGVDQLLRTLTGFAESGAETPAELVAMIDEIIPVAIWAYSADGQTVAMSQRWARITGQPPGRFEQHEWRQAMHPDDRERLAVEWRAFAVSTRERWTSQYRVVRVDTGEERLVTSRGVRLPPGSGMSFVGVTEDVTERVRAEAEVRRLAAEQSALQRVAALVAARPDPAAVSDAVAHEVLDLFEAQGAGLVRFDHDGIGEVTGWAAAAAEAVVPPGTRLEVDAPYAVSRVFTTGGPVRTGPSEVPVDIEFAERVAVPVHVGGQLWGALAIVASGSIEEGAEERLAKFAELLALAIAEADARAAVQLRVCQQAAVNELSAMALHGTPTDELLGIAMQRVVEVLDAPSATVAEALGGGEAVIRAAAGEAAAAVGTRFGIAPDTISGATLASGESLVVDDLGADERFATGPAATVAGMTGGVSCPIRLPDRLWGVVCLFTARRRRFTADDVSFLESVANVIGSAIERAAAVQTILHQALHDGLTGVPNRTLLVDRLEQALERSGRTGALVGVLAIDLDRFKDVNDTYGHPTGDALLVAVAEELSVTIRPGDTLARVGGDAFAVVAEGLAAPEEALALADRLLRVLQDPKAALTGASIGVAVRRHGDAAGDAMRDADTALHRAKVAGRGRVELFDNEMRARMLDRLQTETDLAGALERNELDLFYQPIVSLADGTISGLEGLIRWRHPTRGLVAPAAFIPIAEETNAIIEIGRFVIARACADAARWNARGGDERTIAVSVNLSPAQLADPDLPQFIETSIAASGIAAAQLGLEITESVVLDDDPAHAAVLLELQRLGVQLLLDDFGTGYSSLSHLQRVPLDCVKLDRSFVSGIGANERDTAIVVAIRQLARALGLIVIAEGVETGDQVAALQGIGAEFAQGYHFARPLEREQVDALLDADEPWRLEPRPGGEPAG